MPRSENGWAAYNTSGWFVYSTVEGFGFFAANADVAIVFGELIRRWAAHVEPLHLSPMWCWSWSDRNVRGSDTMVSNHASATALDFNAPQHPRGVHGTYTAQQVAAIHEVIAFFDGVLTWGGSFLTTVDQMHVEITNGTTPSQVAALAKKIQNIHVVQEDDVSFSDKHALTAADVAALGGPVKVGEEVSYGEIVRFPPAVARLRREQAARDAQIEEDLAAVKAQLTTLITAVGKLTEKP